MAHETSLTLPVLLDAFSIEEYYSSQDTLYHDFVKGKGDFVRSIQNALLKDSLSVLDDGSILDTLSSLFDDELKHKLCQMLVQYAETLKGHEFDVFQMILRRLSILDTVESDILKMFNTIPQTFRKSLLLNMHKIPKAKQLQIIERIWEALSDADKPYIFDILSQVQNDMSLDLKSNWRIRAFQLISKIQSLDEFYYVLHFIIGSCINDEEAKQSIEQLRIHTKIDYYGSFKASNASKTKRGRNLIPTECITMSLHSVSRLMVGNKFFLEGIKMNGCFKNDVICLFLLLLWLVEGEKKCTFAILKGFTTVPLEYLQRACDFLLEQDSHNVRIISELAHVCASHNLYDICGIFYTSALSIAEPFASREIVESLTSNITAGSKSAEWAIGILTDISDSDPQLLLKHSQVLKIVLDYLTRMTLMHVRRYYGLLIRLAEYSWGQFGDGSVWNELLIIFKKQVSSLDLDVRQYGVMAILAISDVMSKRESKDILMDVDEATCSQVPKPIENSKSRFIEPYFQLLDSLFTNLQSTIVNYYCSETVKQIRELPLVMVEKLYKRICPLFEDFFVFEIRLKGSAIEPCLDIPTSLIDGDDALIAISFFDKKGSSIQHGLCMSSIFNLLQHLERSLNEQCLDNIDAIFSCPILLPSFDLVDISNREYFLYSFVYCEWLRTLINAFHDQKDKDVQENVSLRMASLEQATEQYKKYFERHCSQSELFCNSLGGLVCLSADVFCKTDGKQEMDSHLNKELQDYLISLLHGVSLSNISKNNQATVTVKPNQYRNLLTKIIPNVITKSCGQYESFLDEIEIINEEWSTDNLIAIANVAMNSDNNRVIIKIIKELKGRNYPEITGILKALQDKTSLDSITSLYELLEVPLIMGSAKGWEGVCEEAIEMIYSNSSTSSVEVTPFLERIMVIHGHDLDLISVLLARYQETIFTFSKKAVCIYTCLFGSLSNASFKLIEEGEKGIILFEKLVQIGRNGMDDNTGYSEAILTYGRFFLNRSLIKTIFPLFESNFSNQTIRSLILTSLKTLQTSTRSIQIICNHLKLSKLGTHRRCLPLMRQSLESVLFMVKQMLQRNDCLSAFWIGNLKHRSLDGTETGSQIDISEIDADDDLIDEGDEETDIEKDEILL